VRVRAVMGHAGGRAAEIRKPAPVIVQIRKRAP